MLEFLKSCEKPIPSIVFEGKKNLSQKLIEKTQSFNFEFLSMNGKL
jgi:hypothetical protein